MERVVGPVIEANPWNKVFRMILDGADLIAFEPRVRVVRPLHPQAGRVR